jgi:hypothetical protein
VSNSSKGQSTLPGFGWLLRESGEPHRSPSCDTCFVEVDFNQSIAKHLPIRVGRYNSGVCSVSLGHGLVARANEVAVKEPLRSTGMAVDPTAAVAASLDISGRRRKHDFTGSMSTPGGGPLDPR